MNKNFVLRPLRAGALFDSCNFCGSDNDVKELAFYAGYENSQNLQTFNICADCKNRLLQELSGGITSSHKEIKSDKSIKSAADADLNYADPGYFRWENGVLYDKDNNHWDFNDYINGNVEPYTTYMDAVKATADTVEDSYTKDEIAEPWEYAEYLVTYALEQLPDPGKFCKEYEGL